MTIPLLLVLALVPPVTTHEVALEPERSFEKNLNLTAGDVLPWSFRVVEPPEGLVEFNFHSHNGKEWTNHVEHRATDHAGGRYAAERTAVYSFYFKNNGQAPMKIRLTYGEAPKSVALDEGNAKETPGLPPLFAALALLLPALARSRRVRIPLLAVALLALAPVASAHMQTFSEATTLRLGNWSVLVDPQPAPVYEGQRTTIMVQVSDLEYGRTLDDLTVEGLLRGPGLPDDGTPPTGLVQRLGYGTYLLNYTAPNSGNYTLAFTLKAPDGTERASNASFRAYPNVPVRILPGDAAQDPSTNRTTPLVFYALKPDGATPAPIRDLAIRLEHWSDDHKILHDYEDVPTVGIGDGKWRADHTFRSRGMFHMWFASSSGGFAFGDVPMLHTYATEGRPDERRDPTPERESPATGWLAAALATLAAAAGAARRRGPRSP